ncbi:MAG: NAD(P)-dependent alcohol dehydrogenase [Pseudomonadota bacterium]
MKLRYKILNSIVAILVVGIAVLAVFISYDSECEPVPAAPDGADTMKAVVYTCYGSSDVLQYVDIEKPVPGDAEVFVKVRAAGVNPLDVHYMTGSPYLMRLSSGTGKPDDISMGVDFAGIVEAVGSDVTKFSPGDRVYGGWGGAFAEYLAMPEDRGIAKIPDSVSFEQAASLPIAAVTALQSLRDHGGVEAGQKVLINGASGGVGTYAVQIAKSMGAEVHGVCSTRNVELVKSLGADHVYDYKKESYTDSGEQYDVILDMVSNESLSANRSVMKPDGRLVIVGGDKGNWIAPLKRPIAAMITNWFVDQEIGAMLAVVNQDDLQVLADLMESGQLTSSISERYPLAEIANALDLSATRRARGKIVITIGAD